VPIEKFIDNIPKIIETFKDSKIIWYLPTPIDQSKHNIIGKEIPNEIVKKYHDIAMSVCKEHDIAYIDSFAIFEPMLNSGDVYHNDDGIHYIDKAYEIIASEVAKILNG
jgi:lysophospholipase L1-like esterase